ncbi:accessory gland protein Acp29AB-like [Drosophila ficusphila]|uniref:accessory gland protein Acp29AB-like n=1 Tax=Drosophila ficusphila TaxID=30025 RepID=UPI0007E653D6|nr:accessory gland protein Acp29AB-like [Drosophila ficusphila]
MRHILVLLVFGLVWQKSLASPVIEDNEWDETVESDFYSDPLSSESDTNESIFAIEKVKNKFEQLTANFKDFINELFERKGRNEKNDYLLENDYGSALAKMDSEMDTLKSLNEIDRKSIKMIGTKYYYIENHEKLSWGDADEKCLQMDGNLVTLQNWEEWSSISLHLERKNNYWIDLHSQMKMVSQTTGELAPSLMWKNREDREEALSIINNEYCVELNAQYDHYMMENNCSRKNHFICEIRALDAFNLPSW